MSSPKPKTFRVRFCVSYWCRIDVQADSKLSAMTKVEDLFDIDRGADHGWEAEEVIQ